MPLDQALVGSLLTGALALASQIVAKTRCYVACKSIVCWNYRLGVVAESNDFCNANLKPSP